MRRIKLTILLALLVGLSFYGGYTTSETIGAEWWRIVKENADQEYDIEKYNCVNFSRDLVRKLREAGYESDIAIGDTPGGYHAWVTIWIEPITGKVVRTNQNYQKDLRGI